MLNFMAIVYVNLPPIFCPENIISFLSLLHMFKCLIVEANTIYPDQTGPNSPRARNRFNQVVEAKRFEGVLKYAFFLSFVTGSLIHEHYTMN